VDPQQQSRWRPNRRQLLGAGVAVGLLTIAILIGYRYGITLWDWIKLLIVPAVIAGGGLWFNAQQREREQRIANERSQDEALQAYLDQLSYLLLEKDLRKSEEGSEVLTLARARTATVIQRLDAEGNRNVIRFLNEAGLTKNRRSSIRLLAGVDLQGAHLGGIDLGSTDLSEANLSDADLIEANLSNARGITKKQLEKQTENLKGALMPDKTKHH
jgi:uncharacterized protein YjbI with pentapeptide repeats